MEDCWEAVEETRSAVLRYIEDNEICVEDITKDSEVIKALKKFDE